MQGKFIGLPFFCLMAWVYILYSKKIEKFYIGICRDSIEKRIGFHNEKKYGRHRFTACTDDWQLYIKLECRDIAHAVRVERKIKSMKSSKYIKNLYRYPELSQRVLRETEST